MDPASIVALVQSLFGLAVQVGSVAKTLNNFVGKFKHAELDIESLAQNLDILQYTWNKIGQWFDKKYTEDDDDCARLVRRSLEIGTQNMEALEQDLPTGRMKLFWNEKTLQGHQTRIRDQISHMSLILHYLSLRSSGARVETPQESESQFQNLEETGYLINPDKSPTPALKQLLLGVADYIKKNIAPWSTQALTPIKLASFYRIVGGNCDNFFLDNTPASLSFIYKSLGCYHNPQSEGNPYAAPAIPALTPAGFVKWQMVQLLRDPKQHVPFLQNAVKRFDLRNPAGGTPFFKLLPKENLPCQPDIEMVEFYENIMKELNGVGGDATRPNVALSEPENPPHKSRSWHQGRLQRWVRYSFRHGKKLKT